MARFMLYNLAKPLLFSLDGEDAHSLALRALALTRNPPGNVHIHKAKETLSGAELMFGTDPFHVRGALSCVTTVRTNLSSRT